MIRISYDEIINRIMDKTGYTKETVEDLINKKVKQLSGLITKEGAAHIVANELGIKLIDKVSGKLQIKNVLVGMRDVEIVGLVKNNFGVREFATEKKQGKVASLIIADETGTIRVVLWNDMADKVKDIKVGDTVKILSGYVRGREDNKEIHLNDRSKIIVNPPGEKVNVDLNQTFSRTYVRKKINELKDTDKNAELRVTIVQAFEPRFYEVCPECGRKLELKEGGFSCPIHGKVTPKQAYVMNLIGDDGSGTIRLVFFRDQVLKVLDKKAEELLVYKDSPEEFDKLKHELLGTEIIVKGRVSVNKMFGKIEFMVDDVEKPDYDKEISEAQKKLDELPKKDLDEIKIADKTQDAETTSDIEEVKETEEPDDMDFDDVVN